MSNWYDFPKYYDVAFSHEMHDELAFLKAVCRSYHYKGNLNLLEPACGTGRLLVPLTKAGYQCTGIDINTNSLKYLQAKLQRQGLEADLLQSDISDFKLASKFDLAYCTVDSFRHLLTEKAALSHLASVAHALDVNGIYILGMHLINAKAAPSRIVRWTHSRGRLLLKTSMSMVALNTKKRRETLEVIMQPVTNEKKEKQKFQYDLRTYTLKQFQSLLKKSGAFRIIAAYNEYYDLDKPIHLTEKSDYAVLMLQRL